mgnify:CR=1 FL=1
MKKEFSISNDKVLLNFSAKYCTNFESVLDSEGFRRVLDVYLKKSEKKRSLAYRYLVNSLETTDLPTIRGDLTLVFKWLTIMNAKEVCEFNPKYENLLRNKEDFTKVIEDFYLFWRRLERYTVIQNDKISQGLAAMNFTEANSSFEKLILRFYRKIEQNVLGRNPKVFREITAGGNCSIMISKLLWPIPKGYEILEDVNEDEVKITLTRDENCIDENIKLKKYGKDKRLGLWVRGKISGVGTITFYDPQEAVFKGIGHAIIDSDTNELLKIKQGYIYKPKKLNIEKGTNEKIGYLYGDFDLKSPIGEFKCNSNFGITGIYNSEKKNFCCNL